VFEIWVPFICLQPEIQVKLISRVFSTSWHNWYPNNKESHTDLLHLHISFTYLLQETDTSPPVQRTWKEFLPSLDQGRIATTNREQQDWHQLELWLHWHVNSDRSDVQLPSLVCGPTHAKDPQRTPATVSLSDLQGLQKNFLPSHALGSQRSHDEVVLHLAYSVCNLSIRFRRYQINSFRETNHERQTVDTHWERNNARKLTFPGSSDGRLCFYSVHSGKKSGMLQKLSMGKLGLTVQTDTEQQAPPGWTLSPPCAGGGAAAAFLAFRRVRCCTWTLNLLHRWWGRHCCFSKTLGNFSLSLTLHNPRASQVDGTAILSRASEVHSTAISLAPSQLVDFFVEEFQLACNCPKLMKPEAPGFYFSNCVV
jgi:hypothetical protein